MTTPNILDKVSLNGCLADEISDLLWDTVSNEDPRMVILIGKVNKMIDVFVAKNAHVDELKDNIATTAADIYNGLQVTDAFTDFSRGEHLMFARAILTGTERAINWLVKKQNRKTTTTKTVGRVTETGMIFETQPYHTE